MKLDLPVPDCSTLCRRAQTLLIAPNTPTSSGPMALIVDSTGLRVVGSRGWMREKHGLPEPRRTWRKLHIGFDPENGEFVASCLTTEHVGDPGALPDLLAEVAGPVRRFIAHGAYDGAPTAATIRRAFGPDVELIIPPPKNAAPGECATRNAQIGRYKQVIGHQLCSRRMESQTTETKISAKVLNRMTRLGRAAYERVAKPTGERGECGTSSFYATRPCKGQSFCPN
ncbi:transposase [Sedimentitalea sp.]|uniref:transposase n=1 Tax=Sedimentitalea sp. TaxID=2048915 RepID=UPI003296AE31